MSNPSFVTASVSAHLVWKEATTLCGVVLALVLAVLL